MIQCISYTQLIQCITHNIHNDHKQYHYTIHVPKQWKCDICNIISVHDIDILNIYVLYILPLWQYYHCYTLIYILILNSTVFRLMADTKLCNAVCVITSHTLLFNLYSFSILIFYYVILHVLHITSLSNFIIEKRM